MSKLSLIYVFICKLVYIETHALHLNCGLRISIEAIKMNNSFVYIKARIHYSIALILGLVCSYLSGFMSILK